MPDVVLDAMALTVLVERMIESGGSAPAEAAVVASHLVAANVKGHDSHGVGMMHNYTDQLQNGAKSSFGCSIVPNEQPTVVLDTGSMLIMEAGGSYGQAAAKIAMEAAAERAKAHGICMLGLRNANHIGRVGTYGEVATAQGLVSLHFVNFYHTLVAPWGGTDQRFGTNPICLAVPGTGDNPGVQLDMATSIGAMGKVAVAFRAGKEMPEVRNRLCLVSFSHEKPPLCQDRLGTNKQDVEARQENKEKHQSCSAGLAHRFRRRGDDRPGGDARRHLREPREGRRAAALR